MSKHVGSLEQLLMFAVAHHGGETHGLALRQELERRAGRKISHGAVYTTMDRLERRALVESRLEEDGQPGGGRPRKLYRLTPLGARELAESYQSLARLAEDSWSLVNRLAAEASGDG